MLELLDTFGAVLVQFIDSFSHQNVTIQSYVWLQTQAMGFGLATNPINGVWHPHKHVLARGAQGDTTITAITHQS